MESLWGLFSVGPTSASEPPHRRLWRAARTGAFAWLPHLPSPSPVSAMERDLTLLSLSPPLQLSVFARKKCFAPMFFGKNERSVLVFPWPSLKTLAQPITIRPFFSPSIPWNTTAISHKFPKRKHQMPFFNKKMQAVSLIQRSALLEQLSQVFKQTSYKVFTKFWILYKKLTKFWNYNFFTEFLHYKVLTKSTKFKNRNNKLHKVLETYSTLNFTKLWNYEVFTKYWTFRYLNKALDIYQALNKFWNFTKSCYQVIEFERFYKAFTKVFDAYKLSTKFRIFQSVSKLCKLYSLKTLQNVVNFVRTL